MIGKRKDSRYESGKRSASWLKVKPTTTADFVIGGYTRGATSFDALIIGYYDQGRLLFVREQTLMAQAFDALVEHRHARARADRHLHGIGTDHAGGDRDPGEHAEERTELRVAPVRALLEHARDEHRGQPHEQRDARAVDDAGEDVPAQVVGAQHLQGRAAGVRRHDASAPGAPPLAGAA